MQETERSYPYNQRFYDDLWEGAVRAAHLVLPRVLDAVRPSSLIDFGCGTGAWLSVAALRGVPDLVGVDDPASRAATRSFDGLEFIAADLQQLVSAPRRFDLAMSIEVAEHLPESSADAFVQTLTGSAPVVLFSAAFPGQGGTGHVNEQWPSYWVERFVALGFEPLEVCRSDLWADEGAPLAMKTNTLLFVSQERSDLRDVFPPPAMLDVVPPQLWDSALRLRASPVMKLDQRLRRLWKEARDRLPTS